MGGGLSFKDLSALTYKPNVGIQPLEIMATLPRDGLGYYRNK
jgi:hypothetical protein